MNFSLILLVLLVALIILFLFWPLKKLPEFLKAIVGPFRGLLVTWWAK